jgi:ribose-phosphate pyrophosphokinase
MSMTDTRSAQVFALSGSRDLGGALARAMGCKVGQHEERNFEDGEHKARPLESVWGHDVYVVHSLFGDGDQTANDKLCRLVFFCGAVRDAGARSVTAVCPYLCYARKDRKTKDFDPVTTRYVAGMLESVGVDAVVTLEVHNLAAFQNAFRCRTLHLDAHDPLIDALLAHVGDAPLTVLSPDAGGTKRAEAFRERLAARTGATVAGGFMEKYRSEGVVSGETLVGEVSGRTVVILDDLIASGGTMRRTAQAAQAQGAAGVIAAAAHGLFVGKAAGVFADPVFDAVLITDSVPPFRLDGTNALDRIEVVPVGETIGETLRRWQAGEPLTDVPGAA